MSWLSLPTVLFAVPAIYAVLATGCAWTRPGRHGKVIRYYGVVPAADRPPVSVLKPLCGAEPRLYENLATFCTQDYPEYQLLFGVNSLDDPAADIAECIRRDYADRDIMLLVDPRRHGANRKVGNLINLLPFAKHDLLLVADSDISVPADYLRSVTEPLADPRVGVVTCLYRARVVGRLWARLGALFIDQWFRPAVRVNHAFGSRDFGFGATLALRRSTLAVIGGFAVLRDCLADDYWLARHTRRHGLRTVLSEVVVTTDVTETRFGDLWARETRWLRTIRSVNPVGFAMLFISFTTPWLLWGAWTTLHWGMAAPLLTGENVIDWVLHAAVGVAVGVGFAARFLLHRHATDSWRDFIRYLPFIMVRDMLLLVQWSAALIGTQVLWRGHRMCLDKASR